MSRLAAAGVDRAEEDVSDGTATCLPPSCTLPAQRPSSIQSPHHDRRAIIEHDDRLRLDSSDSLNQGDLLIGQIEVGAVVPFRPLKVGRAM